jgi:hypothetical protein
MILSKQRILRGGAVADVDSSDQVDHIFRDVAGVISDAFEAAGGDEVIEGSLDRAGIGPHHFDGLVLDGGAHFVDAVVGGEQGITLLHELLHYATKLGDVEFDRQYHITGAPGQSASAALTSWLTNDCQNK